MMMRMDKSRLKQVRRKNLMILLREASAQGYSDSDMAKKWEVADAQVSQWKTCRRGIGEQSARKIERNSSLQAYSLDREDFEIERYKIGSGATDSVTIGPDIVVYYPILGRVPGGEPRLCIENARLSKDTEYIAVSKKYGENSFYLRVVGDSMSPLLSEGMLVLVDPDWSPKHNDVVVVRNHADEGSVKRLKNDGGQWFLVPENARYPVQPLADSTIVGVVVLSVQQFH